MHQHTHTALFTTLSAVVGGVAKVVTEKPMMDSVSIHGLITVIIYASASAAAGYIVKKVLDIFSNNIYNYFKGGKKKDE